MDNLLIQTQAVLTTTLNRWRDLTQTLPPELLAQPPAPGEWSALECLQHLIDVEAVMRTRLEAFLAGRETFPGFNPDEQGTEVSEDLSPQVLGNKFVQLRAENLELLKGITAVDYGRQATHGELGRVTLEQMLHHWAAHDLNHTMQAEGAMLHYFITGVGPWRRFYADHIQADPER